MPAGVRSGFTASDDADAVERLSGSKLETLLLPTTNGTLLDLSSVEGTSVLYFYPMIGHPDRADPDGWDAIPGANGCTAESCGFRDQFSVLRSAGVDWVYGVSSQDIESQREAIERLKLPFHLISDRELRLARMLRLPTFELNGTAYFRRVTVLVHDGIILKVFYPVSPEAAADTVLNWIRRP